MVLFNYAIREITAKLVYYGPGLCGKTTNLQFIHEKIDPSARGKLLSLATDGDRTLFFDFLPIEMGSIGGYKVRFQLYTVPGQVHYNATRKLVLKGVDAVVFVADSQVSMVERNRESFENLTENLIENGYNPEKIPVVIQMNKRDLPNIASVGELVVAMGVEGYPVIEAVASKGNGVFETLKAVVKLTLSRLRTQFDTGTTDARPLTPAPVQPPPEPAAVFSPPPPVPAPPPIPEMAPVPGRTENFDEFDLSDLESEESLDLESGFEDIEIAEARPDPTHSGLAPRPGLEESPQAEEQWDLDLMQPEPAPEPGREEPSSAEDQWDLDLTQPEPAPGPRLEAAATAQEAWDGEWPQPEPAAAGSSGAAREECLSEPPAWALEMKEELQRLREENGDLRQALRGLAACLDRQGDLLRESRAQIGRFLGLDPGESTG